jgi:hypothetical protein
MAGVVAVFIAALVALPGTAAAHGPIAPIATDYLARVGQVPDGLRAQVIDGDQGLWLKAPARQTVVVLDYRGAPYLRFSPDGVAVNRNSAMYYLNQTPAQTPPPGLGPRTTASWSEVSGGHSYLWHDGRLHALATVALPPGASYVGRWSIPLRVGSTRAEVSGRVWHSGRPSIVWFWPLVVLLACTVAAWRVRRPGLDLRVARVLSLGALVAIAAAAVARSLHGRPSVTVVQWITLALSFAFIAWALWRMLFQRPGYFTYFVIAFVAIWEGAELAQTLWDGFVLAAVPAFVARAAAVLGLGCGASLLLLVLRLADQARSPRPDDDGDSDSDADDGSTVGGKLVEADVRGV